MSQTLKNPKVFLLILLAAAATVGVVFLLFGSDSKINQNNLQMIRSYGWEVEDAPAEITRISIPEEFDFIYQAYNANAQAAGFDLMPYRGRTVTRYSYRVLNHQDSAEGYIRANVFVSKESIVAADISSLAIGGFLQPISETDGMLASPTP